MKLTAIILLSACLAASAKGNAQRITLTAKNATLEKVFAQIQQQTGYQFIYTVDIMQTAKPVDITIKDIPLEQALQQIFRQQPLTYSIVEKVIVVKSKPAVPVLAPDSPPAIDIKGRILNEKSEPVLATLTVKGTNKATSTDANGYFELKGVDENAVLVITGVSIETIELKLNGKTDLATITAKTKVTEGEEVVVEANTGYQKLKPNEVNGSFVVIDQKTLNEQTGTSLLQRLNNVSSGVYFNVNKAGNISIGGPVTGLNGSVSIRGFSTLIASMDPLIVLDNFIYEGSLNNINPNDVENITILKDAAAASIWGARAGNGVIVITTKKAKQNQKVSVEFNQNLIIAAKPDFDAVPQISTADFIDVEQYLFRNNFRLTDTASVNRPALSPVYEILLARKAGKISAADSAAMIDHLKTINSKDQYSRYFYRKAVTQQYAINVKGGSANHSWLLSGAFDKSLMTLKQEFTKANVRMENTYRPMKNLELRAGAYYTNSEEDAASTLFAFNSVKLGNTRLLPYFEFADANGNPLPVDIHRRSVFLDTVGAGRLLDWRFYPLDEKNHDRTVTRLQELIGNVSARYQVFPSLSASIQYQYQSQWATAEQYADIESHTARNWINTYTNLAPGAAVKYPIPIGGILITRNNWIRSQNIRGQLDFRKEWGHHGLNAIAGAEARQVKSGGDQYALFGYSPDPQSYAVVDFKGLYPTNPTGSFNSLPYAPSISSVYTNRFVSAFANASYSFKKRYTVSASARRDGSNIFGATTNTKWKPLWSVGGSWVISKEGFYKLSWLPELRLRTSFGYSGNIDQRRTPLPVLAYSTSSLTGFPTARISSINIPNLRWEQVKQWNIGLEFSAKGSTISGSIDVYKKIGMDLYGRTTYDYTAWGGSTTIITNSASMESKGFDIVLRTKNINRIFKWNTQFLLNYNQTKTKEYYTTSPQPIANLMGDGNIITPVAGKPLYAIAAYQYAGLNANGDPQGYLDGQLSTNYTAISSSTAAKGLEGGSLVYVGPANPTHFGAIINEFTWKGIALSVNISYRAGYYFRKPVLSYNSLFNAGLGHPDYLKRWQKPGDEAITDVPGMVFTSYPQFSERSSFYNLSIAGVLKGDHLRLNYINLSYSFPKLAFFKNVQLYSNIANLGIIWATNKEGIDPDYPGILPPPKTYTIGIRGSL